MEKTHKRKDGGFGLRLTFAIFMTLAIVPFAIMSIIFGYSDFGRQIELFNIFGGITTFFAVFAVISYVCAFAGVTHKWANVLLIIFNVPLCLMLVGILPVVGGALGIRDINDPQGAEERRKKSENGFGLRLASAVIWLLCFLFMLALFIIAFITASGDMFLVFFFLFFSALTLVYTIMSFATAYKGKKSKAANIACIAFNSFMSLGLVGICGLIGGLKGYKYFKANEQAVATDAENVQTEFTKGDTVGETPLKTLADYPVDYENKPAVSRLLDLSNRENIFLENEDGTKYEFHQLYVTVKGGAIYALTKTVGLDEDELVVFCVDYASDTFYIEKDEAICESVWKEYNTAVKAQEEEYAEEYIQHKTSPKAKKAITIAATVSYGLLLLMGILFASVPAMSGFFSSLGICESESARAYGIAIGVMWVTLATAAGYLFVTIAPWDAGKKGKIIIAAVTTALLIVMNVVFFVVINAVELEDGAKVKDLFEDDDSWFIPVSTVFASLAIIVCHALTFFRINPNRIKARKPRKSDSDGIFEMIKYVLANIVYGLLCLIKLILVFKEKLPEVFILTAVILLSWLAHFVSFIIAILCIVLLVGVVIMYFAGVISLGYSEGKDPGMEKYTFINDMGCEQTVYSIDGKSFYNADGSYAGKSSDGGKHITPD